MMDGVVGMLVGGGGGYKVGGVENPRVKRNGPRRRRY